MTAEFSMRERRGVAEQLQFTAPLYQQVRDNIKSKITNGEWRIGSIIPGDSELSRQLGVSIGTVRKALDELARQRILVRERGRGTFINQPETWSTGSNIGLRDKLGRTFSPTVTVLRNEIVRPTGQEALDFNLFPRRGVEIVLHRIYRRWDLDERPVCADRITFNPLAFQRLPDAGELLDPALDQICADRCKLGPSHSEYSFQLKPQDSIDPKLRACFPAESDGRLLSCLRTISASAERTALTSKRLVDLSIVAFRLGADG